MHIKISEEMYHIQALRGAPGERLLQVGDHIDCRESNPYSKYCGCPDIYSPHDPTWTKGWLTRERECVLENIRSREFPELPSRRRCIWLCDRRGSAFWLTFYFQNTEGFIQGVTFRELEGVLFRTNDEHLGVDEFNNPRDVQLTPERRPKFTQKVIRGLEAKARSYWSGEGNGQTEYLFEGKARVTALRVFRKADGSLPS